MTAQGHLDSGFGPLELEAMSESDQRAALVHLDACARCTDEFRLSADTLASLALALPPVAPPPELRERMLRDVRRTNRFEQFVTSVAGIIDVTVDTARALLARLDDAAAWVPSPMPGVTLYHLDGGPAVAQAVVGFVRIEPAHQFPEHTHQGDEVMLILQGAVEERGRVTRRGELVQMAQGTSHELKALPGPAFIYLGVAQNGFTMFGEHIKPGDPRA